MMIFMFPETLYKRPNPAASDHSSSMGRSTPPELKTEEVNMTQAGSDAEKAPSSLAKSQRNSVDHIHPLPERPVGRPSKRQFSLIPRPEFEDKDLVFRDILAPIQIFSFPIILWAAFSFNFAANCLLALNLTQSQVFAAPPYLFSPAQVGFVNFAFVVGGVIGLLTAGPFSDWISMRATARNKGVREPEMRLIALVPYVCICLVGMTVSSHSSAQSLVAANVERSLRLDINAIGHGKQLLSLDMALLVSKLCQFLQFSSR